jgi:hypothetical protein
MMTRLSRDQFTACALVIARLRLRRRQILRLVFAADGRRPGPWESALNVVAMVLLGVAWLALVLGLRWQLRTTAVAALPGLATLAFAGAVAIGNEDDSFPWAAGVSHARVGRRRCIGRDLGMATRDSRPPHPTPGSRAVGERRPLASST